MRPSQSCHRATGWIVALSIIVVGGCGCLCNAQDSAKEIVGYYPSWKWKVMSPSQIPFDKLTSINYAFFRPLPDGTIVGRDSVGDGMILGKRGESTSLILLAHRHGVKVLLSIGGWTDSDDFPAVASHDSSRIMFAHSCVEQIRRHGFDGIDLDWEYPGYVGHKGTRDDGRNFTILLRLVRDSLTAYGNQSGTRPTLTAAVPAFKTALSNYEVDSLVVLLDAFNVMTYDFNGPWSPLSGHNAPLYASGEGDSVENIDAAFRLYAEEYGISSEKINLGVPFYGHTFSGCTALRTTHSGEDTSHFPGPGSFYSAIAPMVDSCLRVWDDRAKVPYLICKKWSMLVSYDDSESVLEKARYVLEHHARGLIVWEITGDFMPDGKSPLLGTLSSILRNNVKGQ